MTTFAGGPGARVRRLSWLLAAAVVVLVGCGGPTGDGPGASPATSAGSPLAFTATTLDGKPFDGMSLAGKPTVLWFWAPWCPICLQQAPGVRKAVDQYADKVNIVGVAGLDKVEAMPEFVRLAKVEAMPHIADEAGVVWKRFEVTAQSTLLLIDTTGKVTFRGRLNANEIPDRVAALVG